MNVLPPIAFEQHVQNLLEWLRVDIPEINTMPLWFFDRHDLELREGRWMLSSTALKDVDTFRIVFERLCNEGREWIHLGGEGLTARGEYLVSVDYSDATGRHVTSVNLAGTPLNADGSVMKLSKIIII